MAETGLEPSPVDRRCREAGGSRMGPLELADLVGHDLTAAVSESVWRALDLDPRTWVVRTLDQRERGQPGGRFRVCPPMRLAALRDRRLHD